jgi:hypothetical protein
MLSDRERGSETARAAIRLRPDPNAILVCPPRDLRVPGAPFEEDYLPEGCDGL